jgi:D-glycero-D-manno-heptose 1,7-bisphosphate phosphatase
VSGRWTVAAGGQLALDAATPRPGEGRVGTAFLDRDGVLIEGAPDPESGHLESPLSVGEVSLLPAVVPALLDLAAAGFALVCISNQPAAAKGKVSLGELLAVHERTLELLAEEGVRIDGSRLCPHHPQGIVAGLSIVCRCRKPSPGMLFDAAEQLGLELSSSWMLGDTDADIAAGAAAGCRTALIGYPGTAHKRSGKPDPDLHAADLADAAAQVLDLGRG